MVLFRSTEDAAYLTLGFRHGPRTAYPNLQITHGTSITRYATEDSASDAEQGKGSNTSEKSPSMAMMVESLFEAYDADEDGVLNKGEVIALAKDTRREIGPLLSSSQKEGLSQEDLAAHYIGVPKILRQDFARAFEPAVISVMTVGAVAITALRLGQALRQSLTESLQGDRRIATDIGRGTNRIREGWFLADDSKKERIMEQEVLQFICPADDAKSLGGDDEGSAGFGSRPEDGSDTTSGEEPWADFLFDLTGGRQTDKKAAGPRTGQDRPRPGGLLGIPGSVLSARVAASVEDGDGEDDERKRAYKSARDFRVLKKDDATFVSMSDFQGCPDVKQELQELVELLKNPERYARIGAVPPKGVLFCGEPGTGKTFAARAVASEAGVPFLAISGSDFRQSPYSGIGTSMTLRMFEEAKKKAPCLVFIDEIDSLGEARRSGPTAFQDAGEMGGSVTRDQDANLNMLLAKLDGFTPSSGVLFLAATNRPEVLDEALLRSGRFDRRIEFRLPNAAGRAEILNSYASRLKFEDTKETPDFELIAKQTPAFSPADLKGMLNSAATAAVRAGRDGVKLADVDASLEEIKKRKAKARPEGNFQVTDFVDVTFKDVKGHDEVLEELRDVVDMLTHRERYQKLGARTPRGVLMDGPPGVGKTHCARALAGEVGLPFLTVSGSDFQASRYAGQGTQLVKRLFAYAKKLQPCIVFIDEVDALGRRRGSEAAGAEQDRESTLMQLLVELDGFDDRNEVLLVAATNRAEVLDPALLRPGRLDRRVSLDLPDQRGRRSILQLHTEKVPLAEDVDLDEIARRTAGMSGADLRNIVNEAAILAAKADKQAVPRDCVFRASDRISLGLEKTTPMRSSRARQLTAVHEAGHAVLGIAFAPLTQRHVARISIRPRTGGVGGVTVFEPEEEGREGGLPAGIHTKEGSIASLCVELGGRAAEEAMLGPLEVSSGASADLAGATRRAMAMASDWGLTIQSTSTNATDEAHGVPGTSGNKMASLSPMSLSLSALGHRCSDATLREAEQAAGVILARALDSSRRLLSSDLGRNCLEVLVQKLLEKEEVQATVFEDPIFNTGELRRAAQSEAEAWLA